VPKVRAYGALEALDLLVRLARALEQRGCHGGVRRVLSSVPGVGGKMRVSGAGARRNALNTSNPASPPKKRMKLKLVAGSKYL
jgi:hypothetical protein